MNRIRDRTGMQSESLIFLKRVRSENGRTIWLCRCKACGREFQTTSQHANTLKSCGCLRKNRLLKHGQAVNRNGNQPRLYRIWKAMRNRCNNPKHSGYRNYGQRGVRVCDEWDEFLIFQKWATENGYTEPLADTPIKDRLSIDRVDPNGNYEPSNCRWVPLSENSIKANQKRTMNQKKITNRR